MLFAFALLAAAMPSMPAMVRARWTELYRDMPKLNKAFTFGSGQMNSLLSRDAEIIFSSL